jgi:hypothetical protein
MKPVVRLRGTVPFDSSLPTRCHHIWDISLGPVVVPLIPSSLRIGGIADPGRLTRNTSGKNLPLIASALRQFQTGRRNIHTASRLPRRWGRESCQFHRSYSSLGTREKCAAQMPNISVYGRCASDHSHCEDRPTCRTNDQEGIADSSPFYHTASLPSDVLSRWLLWAALHHDAGG